MLTAANNLRRKYQKENNLSLPPLLRPRGLTLSPLTKEGSISQNKINTEISKAGAFPYRVKRSDLYAPTQMEMAEIFLKRVWVRRKGQNIYWFNGCIYKMLTTNEFHSKIMEVVRDQLGVEGIASNIKAIANIIMVEPCIDLGNIQEDESLLCLLNGVLNFQTEKLENFNRQYFLTWQLQASYVGPQPIPVFDQFLKTVTSNDLVLAQRLLEVLGYLLLCPDNRAKKFFIAMRPGDTGKSVFARLIESFFSEDQISSVDILQLGKRFSLSALVSTKINLAMDLPANTLSMESVAVIKSVTGQDLVVAEAKYKDCYTTKINCRLVFSSNHPLQLQTYDQAFVNRIVLLPFNYPIPRNQQDRNLDKHLHNERNGILYKAIIAYKELQKNNYIFCGSDIYTGRMALEYKDPTTSTTISDILSTFIEICCEKKENGFTSTQKIHEAYVEFCHAKVVGFIDNVQLFSAKIRPLLKERFGAEGSKRRVNGIPCNGYLDITLKEDIL